MASVVNNPCGASGDEKMPGILRLRHVPRFAEHVSPLRMTELFLGTEVERMARQVLLAANAPSPSRAGGSCEDGMLVQVWPSFVVNSSNFNFPVSSGMGSPRTMPWVLSQKTMESKKPLGFLLVNCSCQLRPASAVW